MMSFNINLFDVLTGVGVGAAAYFFGKSGLWYVWHRVSRKRARANFIAGQMAEGLCCVCGKAIPDDISESFHRGRIHPWCLMLVDLRGGASTPLVLQSKVAPECKWTYGE